MDIYGQAHILNEMLTEQVDCKAFANLLNDNAQGYKYYWLESIIDLSVNCGEEISFDDIFNEMIAKAWYSVSYYHLRLGPTVNGHAVNILEHAVLELNKTDPRTNRTDLSQSDLRNIIVDNAEILNSDKKKLCHYVPFRLLTPFFQKPGLEEGLKYIQRDSQRRFIDYMSRISGEANLLYTITDGVGLSKKIVLNPSWKVFIQRNASIIKDWIQFQKVQFLQARNPGVPEITSKIEREIEEERNLKDVRVLWKMYSSIKGEDLLDIYSGMIIPENELSIDHFVPRSYVGNDELWDLIPMNKRLNSQKNNRLPGWNDYYQRYSEYHYSLYELVFPVGSSSSSNVLIEFFNKCRKHNLNSLASERLYRNGYNEEQFKNVLKEIIEPVYRSAEMIGYNQWRCE